MDERVILVFAGRLDSAGMVGFARHRATRLALTLELLEVSDRRLRLAVTGQPDLVDAFEMALSLGPQGCLVQDIWRESNGATLIGPDGPNERTER